MKRFLTALFMTFILFAMYGIFLLVSNYTVPCLIFIGISLALGVAYALANTLVEDLF